MSMFNAVVLLVVLFLFHSVPLSFCMFVSFEWTRMKSLIGEWLRDTKLICVNIIFFLSFIWHRCTKVNYYDYDDVSYFCMSVCVCVSVHKKYEQKFTIWWRSFFLSIWRWSFLGYKRIIFVDLCMMIVSKATQIRMIHSIKL